MHNGKDQCHMAASCTHHLPTIISQLLNKSDIKNAQLLTTTNQMFGNFLKKEKSQENGPLEKKEKTKVSNWIVRSCQPHRVTSGQSNSGHKQIHISKLFSYIYIYQPSIKSVYKTDHFASIKHTYTNIRHTFWKSQSLQ